MKFHLVAAMLVLIGGAGAQAQEQGRVSQGRSIAESNCAQCHAVQAKATRSPNEDAPAFARLAATPGVTALALNAALQTSHRSMPNIILQPDERRDVIAYILSLKD
jgi:mono/diheme cytochrome c family protein